MTRFEGDVEVRLGGVALGAAMVVPDDAAGIVLFAHGSGSSRHSPRNRHVAAVLHDAGLGTVLIDLLTGDEEEADRGSAALRFDIGLLARRVAGATEWLRGHDPSKDLRVGYFGASTGAAAALVAAAEAGKRIAAVVSRGGRPDLADEVLPRVKAATLLIVGERDVPVIEMNERAYGRLTCEKALEIVPRASHLFEEPGALDEVARLAREWFVLHLSDRSPGCGGDAPRYRGDRMG